ncbi:MAG: GNAT family N-acetyltransferase [Prevotellaceae bacterium]|jgi:diamine N-acetyltransferase|nr:GNAT family N-acetyltransferase [Prevotellaceae bacterium]
MKLETERIKLRSPEISDVDLLYKWENDCELWPAGESFEPYSRFDIERYVMSEGDVYANKQLRLMIDLKIADGQKTIGTADLFDFNPLHSRAGLGILIYPPDERRKGYAHEAMQLLIRYAFEGLLIKVLYCNVSANNEAGLRCVQKAGFEICGLKKQWTARISGREDEYLLQILNENP